METGIQFFQQVALDTRFRGYDNFLHGNRLSRHPYNRLYISPRVKVPDYFKTPRLEEFLQIIKYSICYRLMRYVLVSEVVQIEFQ